MSSLDPHVSGQHPESRPPTKPDPAVVLVVAAVCATAVGYFNDWEHAFAVFVAVVSLFTGKRDE